MRTRSAITTLQRNATCAVSGHFARLALKGREETRVKRTVCATSPARRVNRSGDRHHRVIASQRIRDRAVDLAELGHQHHRHGVFAARRRRCASDRPTTANVPGGDFSAATCARALAGAGADRQHHAIDRARAGHAVAADRYTTASSRGWALSRCIASSPMRMPTGMNEPKPPCTRVPSLTHSSGVSAGAAVTRETRAALQTARAGRLFASPEPSVADGFCGSITPCRWPRRPAAFARASARRGSCVLRPPRPDGALARGS